MSVEFGNNHQLSYAEFRKVSPSGRLQLKCDGTRLRTGGEVKGKLANGVGGQYPSHSLGTRCIQHYYRWWRAPRLPVVDWTDAPTGWFKWTRPFHRKNLVSVCVPSHFKCSLPPLTNVESIEEWKQVIVTQRTSQPCDNLNEIIEEINKYLIQ